jgi:ABC-type multidrug transport system ATPase subunit
VLTIEKLTKRYGSFTALREVSMNINPGILGLLGPNGAGKTTMMSILATLLPRSGGQVLWDGQDIVHMGGAYRSLLGYMPQSARYYKTFTAGQMLGYMAELKGLNYTRAQLARVIDEKLELVNLSEWKKKRLGTFSGGMLQRLGVAQALLGSPKLIILDEPTSGLDPQERIRLRGIISQVSRECAVIWATHIVSDIEYIASEVALLNKGVLACCGSPDKLLRALYGRVWSLTVPFDEADRLMAQMNVRSFARRENGVSMRLFSDDKPHPDALPDTPNLEDLYVSVTREA